MTRTKKRVREEKPVEPPMTPMIDIIFQLLVFFILTLQIRETEGKLLNQLPKRVGQNEGHAPADTEIRIRLCSMEENVFDHHRTDKGRHEAALERLEQSEWTRTGGKHLILNDVCSSYVDRNPVGRLYKTWLCPRGHREEGTLNSRKRAFRNKKCYRKIAQKAKDLSDLTPSHGAPPKRHPVVIDMDSSVPYEHILGVINALKEVGIQNVQFVANARHSRYYGTRIPAQFDTDRGK